MKAAVVKEWGEVPRYTDFPDPRQRDGAVVATVEASALTNLTRGLVSGNHYASKELQLPRVPGVYGVARLEDGRRVLEALSASHPSAHYHPTHFVQIGSMAGPTLTLPAGIVRGTGIVISGVGLGSVPSEVMARSRAEALPRLFEMVASGELHLRTATRPLADVEQAWTTAEPSGTRVVLTP